MRFQSDNGDRARRALVDAERRFRASPFTVFELIGDAPEQLSVGDSRWEYREAVSLGLACGNPLERPVGQLAQIITSRIGHEPEPLALLQSEHDERDLGPVAELDRDTVTLSVETEQIEASRIRSDYAWVVYFDVGDLNVTVVGVQWDPTQLPVRPVRNVGPYFRGWRELLGPWAK